MKTCLSDSGISINVPYGDGEVDFLTKEEFISRYGEENLPEENICGGFDAESYLEYWCAAADLIEAWIEYQKKRKLFATALNEETKHRVQSVVDDYYRGDIDRLKKHTQALNRKFYEKLAVYIEYCRKNNVDFSEPHLKSCTMQKDYTALSKGCEERMAAKTKPLPLYCI